jgi:hypothetical protein
MGRRIATVSALVIGMAHAGLSTADTNPVTSEALFQEAKRLITAGKYVEACPKLEESHRLDPATGTLLNLGVCYEKMGRNATAWAKFNEAASAARREGRSDRFTMATEHARALEPTLSRILVSVSPGADAPGLEVRVDSTVLGKASWGVAIPYDPGNHQVTAAAPGKKQFKKAIALGAKSDRQEIVIGALEAGLPQQTTSEASTVVGATSTSPASAEAGSSSVPIFLIGGLGIVGLGVGTYFGVKAISLSQESNQKCPTTFCDDAAAVEMMQTANRDAWIANVAIGVGVVGVGVATYLFFAGRGSKETKSGLTVLPLVGVREGGLSLRRSW